MTNGTPLVLNVNNVYMFVCLYVCVPSYRHGETDATEAVLLPLQRAGPRPP